MNLYQELRKQYSHLLHRILNRRISAFQTLGQLCSWGMPFYTYPDSCDLYLSETDFTALSSFHCSEWGRDKHFIYHLLCNRHDAKHFTDILLFDFSQQHRERCCYYLRFYSWGTWSEQVNWFVQGHTTNFWGWFLTWIFLTLSPLLCTLLPPSCFLILNISCLQECGLFVCFINW